MTKHSLLSQKVSSVSKTLLLFGLIVGLTHTANAQMFSVGSEEPRFNRPQTNVFIGLEPMNFEYNGGNLSNPRQEGVFEFSGSIIRLGYNSTGVDLFLGTGGEITGIDDASYFDVGGNVDFGLNLFRSRSLTVQIPGRIAFRYTNVTNNEAFQSFNSNQFRFGSLTGGLGLRLSSRPAEKFRIQLGAVPNYGFAFPDGGSYGGALTTVDAYGRMYFDRLFGDIGLSAGYSYDYRNYNIDEDQYDYIINGHSIEVGITF